MNIISWFWIFGIIFIVLLVIASIKSYTKNRTADEFMLAKSNVKSVLGFLTYSAALFSAFTFMGMPDFFRNHGVGAWIFLGVSDGAMVFFILWFGYKIRLKAKELGFKGVAGMVAKSYNNPGAGYLLFFTAFIFLIPYVAIQIRGISIFLNAIFPNFLSGWGWAAIIVLMMLLYSQIGGLKAIMFSDAVQGLLLLIVIWLIGISCIKYFGGVSIMFDEVATKNKDLLSVPGPKNLFTPQFLIASLIAIVCLPITQPQFSTRIVIMKDLKSMQRMAFGVGVFAILVILPTVFIGMYGAVAYSDLSTKDFLSKALLSDQHDALAALAIVGLFAAVLSTTNAQIFALGSELRSLLKGSEKRNMTITKISLAFFALIILVFSTLMSDELVLLARMSFSGTSMMAPLVLWVILKKSSPPAISILYSLIALIVFILSLIVIIPESLLGLRLDIILYIFLTVTNGFTWFWIQLKEKTHVKN